MQNSYHTFKQLHTQPLILTNVWDPASAAIVEKSGATALATSSASLAWSNGYADGGKLPKEILIHAIKNILRITKLPLSVDIEDGYSDSPEKVAQLVADLVKLGVVGINIEDGSKSIDSLANKIKAIRNSVGLQSVFINARTDVYLQQLVAKNCLVEETLSRADQYISSGADGIFVPGLLANNDISQIATDINAPLNIMVDTACNDLKPLIDAGANRFSLGPNTFTAAYNSLANQSLLTTHTELSYESLNQMFVNSMTKK